jgi:hypothetical protein
VGRRAVVGWAGTVVVNVVLGYVGVLPLLFFTNALVNTVGVGLGLADSDYKFGNDGLGFAVGISVFLFLGFAAIFWTVNFWVSRLLKVRGPGFWWTASGIAVLPTVVVMVAPEVWTAIKWF